MRAYLCGLLLCAVMTVGFIHPVCATEMFWEHWHSASGHSMTVIMPEKPFSAKLYCCSWCRS